MVKRKSISSLKKKADKIFSLWIRDRDKRCVTCGSRNFLQAGHFVSRSWSALRYSEKNVNAQCSNCNIWRRGNMSAYAAYLENVYGHGIIQELERLKKPYQLKVSELEEIIKKYA